MRYLLVSLLCVAAWAGKPPLTPEIAHHATSYMEWMLDVRFTAEQREHYREILADMWHRPQSSAEAITSMAQAGELIPTFDAAKSARLRAERQPDFVRLLEKASDDPSRWLFAIYRAAHESTPAPTGDGSLLGRWTTSHISSIQYRNSATGVSAPANGNSFSYEFKSDGTYSFTGLMQSVIYTCTNSTFSNETGTYTLENGAVSLHPEKNPYRITNNCYPSSNREAPGKLIARTYRFSVSEDAGRRHLELKGQDGSVQKFSQSQ